MIDLKSCFVVIGTFKSNELCGMEIIAETDLMKVGSQELIH